MQNETIEGFRLSPQQRHLWGLQQNKSQQTYRVRGAILITGNLDREILQKALQNVVNRHEILRTSFHCLPGMTLPLQAIASTIELPISEYNLSGLSPEEQEAKIAALFEQLNLLPFDFERGPLWHISLVTLAQDKHLLAANFSALIADSVTLKNFTRELSLSYSAYTCPEEPADEPMQYADIAEWQNELLESEETAIGQEYWRKLNIESWGLLTLPWEKKHSEGEFEPLVERVEIRGDLLNSLEAIAQKHHSDISTFLLACWQILIARLTKQPNPIVGVTGNGRKYEELEHSLGLLCKYLPLQCDLQDEFSFAKIWEQVELNLKDIHTWQEYFTWEETLESDKSNAFLPVCFEYETKPEKYGESGVSFFLDRQDACVEPFKLKLSGLSRGNSLIAEFRYDSALFEAEDVKRLSQHFQALLESAVKNPESAIGQLNILSDRDRHQLLVEFNQTQKNYPKDKCVHQLFEEQADRTPDSIAVVFENQKITYRELNDRANRLAHHLQNLGVEPEAIVGICVDRSLETIVGMLGVLKAGGAYLPIDPTTPIERKALMLEDAQVKVLLVQQRLIESLPKTQANIVCIDTDIPTVSTAYTPRVSSDNLAYVIYTSGSTGTPKGVAIEHRQLLNYLYGIQEKLNLPADASFATVSTFAADLGNTAIFPAICFGGCLHIISQERATDPEALGEYFSRNSIDCLKIVPSHLAALLTSSAAESILPRRRLILGGEAASWELIEKIRKIHPDCLIFNHYGPTEATVGVLTYQVYGEELKGISETVPLGKPIANTQIYLLDSHLQPVPIGVPGELHIGGSSLARGYLNRPELTAEKFIRHPFDAQAHLYKTGDLARYLPDGNIEFIGRIDSQVKIRGFRIELGEIEAALGQHPDIAQAVVVAREDAPGEKRLAAYFVSNRKQAPSSSELRRFLATKLPDYMVPWAFVTLKSLPLTPNGKVDRRSLPEPDSARANLEGTFAAPRTPAEETIARIWGQMLEVEKVGIYDNFFELGGDSISSIRIVAKINQAGLRVTPKQLFECPTVAELAAVAATIETTEKLLPVLPIQQEFLAEKISGKCQSFLFKTDSAIAPEQWQQAVQKLLERHDILRLRFLQTESGWQQMYCSLDEIKTEPFSYIDLSVLPASEREITLERTAAELKESLNPAEGILWRVTLFNRGNDRPNSLLLTIHQLAADSVSWQILLEELSCAIAQLSQGQSVELPPATATFKRWSEFLQEYAKSPQIQQERDYWLAARQEVSKLPVDSPTNDEASIVLVSLDVEETRTLLQKVPAAYGTQTSEVLLTALVQTFNQWTKADSLLVDLEASGREIFAKDIDLSRTLGCFAAVFPVQLILTGISGPGEALKAVKEQVRGVPNRGAGFGVLRYLGDRAEVAAHLQALDRSQVRFNYREQFDPIVPESFAFELVESASSILLGNRRYPIEIDSGVRENRLQLEWRYSEAVYRRTTIEKLANDFVDNLRSLVAHCQSVEAGTYTPSDFPKANLSQKDLDRFLAKINQRR
ncbi:MULTISPECIES: amino acid adenylation domain-containing protein [unclassified Microcoleus]|uniref:amino acid adenylation domain-containing protein n=1 Tax=unclassified Microcoleus TaxID=2642155 RepID=UPI002FD07FD1